MNKRTTETRLYHYALSYFRAAQVLANTEIKTTHPDAPTRYLYYHSAELFLKSFLMLKGMSVCDLKEIGHRVDNLAKACADAGLSFDDEDDEVIKLMANAETIIRSRYIETGYFTWPTIEALERTCTSLHSSVRAGLKAAGRPVR